MLLSSPLRRMLQFGKALCKGWCLYPGNSRFGLQIGTKQLSRLTLTKTKLYWNLMGWSKLVVLIKAGNGGMCAFTRGNEEEERLQMILAVMPLSGAEMSEGIEQIVPPPGNIVENTCVIWDGRYMALVACQWCMRQYVGLVAYSGGAKFFWGIGSKESRDGKIESNPKCGNKLSVDASSLASFASFLLTSEALVI